MKLCWHRWITQQTVPLRQMEAGKLFGCTILALFGLFILLIVLTIPAPFIEVAVFTHPIIHKWVVAGIITAIIAIIVIIARICGSTNGPHDLITLRSISDRACYKCGTTQLDATKREIAIQTATKRLEMLRQTMKEVNDV